MTHVSCRLTARDQRSFSVQTTAALAQRGNIVIIVVTAMSTLRWLTHKSAGARYTHEFQFPFKRGPKVGMYVYIDWFYLSGIGSPG